MHRMSGNLESLKTAIWELRRQGKELDAVGVNPMTIPGVIRYIREWGADPFPRSRFSFRHPFRKRDPRPYFVGIPMEMVLQIPPGALAPIGENIEFLKKIMAGDDEEEVNPKEEAGAVNDLMKSERPNLTDLMIRSMEGLDKVEHIVVLRFFDGGMDTFSDYNQLEMQAALQKANIRIMQGDEG